MPPFWAVDNWRSVTISVVQIMSICAIGDGSDQRIGSFRALGGVFHAGYRDRGGSLVFSPKPGTVSRPSVLHACPVPR